MKQELTEDGYRNIIGMANERFAIIIDKKFIDNHFKEMSACFPDYDDEFWVKEYPNDKDDPWWTLVGEANSYGLSDTGQREMLGSFFAHKFAGQDWPTFGDGPEASIAFEKAYKEGATAYGVELIIDD